MAQQPDTPDPGDLCRLGLEPEAVGSLCLIHRRPGHALYRLRHADRPAVLKWFDGSEPAHEVRCYELLLELGVPTLPVLARANSALLLPDLAAGGTWRLATEGDASDPEVGAAVAGWYQAFHAAGRNALVRMPERLSFLGREIDGLTPESVLAIGERLGMGEAPVWRLAADHVEPLVGALRALPETLNYNDFHWTNLALAGRPHRGLRAVVFDYHLMGLGPACSDVRNVTGSMGDAAAAAFRAAYGPVDERAAILDAPLSVLVALREALARPALPRWAEDLRRAVQDGAFERCLRQAIEVM